MELLTKTLFVSIVFAFILMMIISMLRKNKEEEEEEKRLNERLDDDTIYDPLTGLKFTLEEAEKGIIIADDKAVKIKTKEELDTYYSQEEIEVERIKTFIGNELCSVTGEKENFLRDVISRADFVHGYDSFSSGNSVEIGDNLFVSLAFVEYSFPNGKYRNQEAERQVVVVVGNKEIAKHFPGKESIAHSLVRVLHEMHKDISVEEVGNYCMIKVNKRVTLESYIQTVSKIEFTQANHKRLKSL